MRHSAAGRRLGLWLIVVLGAAACAQAPTPAPEPVVATPQPIVETPTFSQTGLASWYGTAHQGQRTASGERFDQKALTAAHPSLPIGTMVRVTSAARGTSVKVRINDRGPLTRGRIIDLSSRAASVLKLRGDGVAPVKLEVFASDQ